MRSGRRSVRSGKPSATEMRDGPVHQGQYDDPPAGAPSAHEGVTGFDFGRQGERSEPWSPEPR
jgi:hypothetical protein